MTYSTDSELSQSASSSFSLDEEDSSLLQDQIDQQSEDSLQIMMDDININESLSDTESITSSEEYYVNTEEEPEYIHETIMAAQLEREESGYQGMELPFTVTLSYQTYTDFTNNGYTMLDIISLYRVMHAPEGVATLAQTYQDENSLKVSIHFSELVESSDEEVE